MYAHEIVDEMLLYNSITMPYKSLYLNGVKKEIFKYEGLHSFCFATEFKNQDDSNDFQEELK
jgi:hypothetical protein